MDNKQFELVTLYNPLDVPFPITYNKEVVRTIPPKTQMPLVRMWADNGKKHLVDKLMRRDGHNLLDKEKRAEYEAKVVVAEEASLLGAQPSQNQLANQLIEKSQQAQNPASDANNWKFDPLTGKPIVPAGTPPVAAAPAMPAPQPVEPQVPLPQPTAPKNSNPEVASILGGVASQQGSGHLPEQVIDDTPAEVPNPADRIVSRDQLLGWARANLPVNLDDPETAARLAAMSDADLRKEFRYDELAA